MKEKQIGCIRNPMIALINRIARTDFVSRAIADKADLSAFRQKPSLKVIAGVTAIVMSFVLGWPMVSFLGGVSVYTGNPWILLVGGPAVYGLSHLVFILGMYLSGGEYSLIFFRWLARITMESLMQRFRA
ncbi:MAG: hypothetical protein V1793_13040 [Pseudomonadota bacterium]